MNVTDRIPLRIANTLLNSLKGGVVPRTGLGYITVGRKDEIDALLNDIEMISEGGASFRFVVGKYGAGKSFLLQTIRNYAMERGFVVMDADLSPERRLVGNRLQIQRHLHGSLVIEDQPGNRPGSWPGNRGDGRGRQMNRRLVRDGLGGQVRQRGAGCERYVRHGKVRRQRRRGA